MTSSSLGFLRFALRRMRAHARLEALVAAGAVTAAALMASVIIYADAVRDLGLAFALRQHAPDELDVRVFSSSQRLAPEEYRYQVAETDRQLRAALGDASREVLRYGRTATFFLTRPGESVPSDEDRPRAHFQFFDGLDQRVRVVEGRPPRAASASAGAPTVEAWVSRAAAAQLGIAVGDRFDLHPFWALEMDPVRVVVVGVFEPIDPNDRVWRTREERLVVTTTRWPTYPLFVPESSITGALVSYLPSIDGAFETVAVVDLRAVNSRTADGLQRRLEALAAALPQAIPRTTVETALPEAIEVYRTKLFFTRLPLFALIVQVVGIVLLYLVIVATLLADRRAGEWAVLSSRGASFRHVMGLAAVEAAVIGGAAAALGPPVAAVGTALLGYTPAFRALSGGQPLTVRPTPEAWLMAVLGAGLAGATIAWCAARSGMRTAIEHRQAAARPPSQPAFLRTYLDVAVLVVAAIAFYQLRSEGSLARQRLLGGATADPVLLAAPTLFMLAVGLVVLRLLPVALRLLALVATSARGVIVPLALWQLVRRPLHHVRLTLLLILATAIGVFAAGFRATLERSYDDRAAYEAGSPARLVGLRVPPGLPPERAIASLADALGVPPDEVALAVRLDASYAAARFRSESVTVLAVDPAATTRIAFWRRDFSGAPLRTLMESLERGRVAQTPGIPVPNDACLGLRAKLPAELPRARLGVRLRSPDGRAWDLPALPYGGPSPEGWQLFLVPTGTGCFGPEYWQSTRTSPPDAPSLQLEAVYLRPGAVLSAPVSAVWYLDEVLAGPAPGAEGAPWPDAVLLEAFDDLSSFEPIGGVSSAVDPGTLVAAMVSGANGRAARVSTRVGPGASPLSGLRTRNEGRLPVLAAEEFLRRWRLGEGDEFALFLNAQVVPARIVGRFELFPGYRPEDDAPLLVTDFASLRVLASRLPSLATVPEPNEVWLGREPGEPFPRTDSIRAEALLRRSDLRAAAASDPLAAASWEGILFLSFATVLGLTAVGFAAYAYLAAERRALEFAVLRTVGFSPAQVFGTLLWEHVVVIGAGLAVGTGLGLPLARLMVDYVAFTETGEAVVPPLVAEVRWTAVLALYVVIGLVFLVTMMALAATYARLALHRALRLGEV